MRNSKKCLCCLCAILLGVLMPQKGVAQKELGIFNSVAVGVGVGTTGVDLNVAMPVTSYLAIRGGVAFMPNISIKESVNLKVNLPSDIKGNYPSSFPMDVEGSIKRTMGELILNCYPFLKSSFFIAAGASFGGSALVQIEGHSNQLSQLSKDLSGMGIDVETYIKGYPVNKNGDVAGGLKVSKVRPYLGIGFGRAVPRKRLSPMVDLGVQFHGKPEIYTDYGDLDQVIEEGEDFQKIIDKIVCYPVLRFRLCGRIF